MRKWFCAGAVVAAAGLATSAGGVNGDIVFTNQTDNSIKVLSGGSLTTLVTFADPTTRLAGITRAGNGKWYVANGPIPPTETSASIYEIDDIFAAAPSVSVLTSGNPSQNPIHLRWDKGRGVLMSINNPGRHPIDPALDGVLAYHLNGTTTTVWSEPDPASRPFYYDGVWMTKIADGTDDYLVVAGNGGAFGGPGNLYSATMWRLSIDGALNGTMSLLADLGDAGSLGLAEGIFDARGLTTTNTGRIFMTSKDNGKVYEIDLSGGFGITEIASGIDYATRIEYNRYTNRLVLAQQHFPAGFGLISEIRLDGTGYTVLTADPIVSPRDLHIVPAPAALALLGIGGLLSARRRRAVG
ncbi:MAG: PEP-CTERM sorting domain-containing protein [Phycisphaeraceae bacterium]|nr:PEP-CTERM sorting domain-containing protein [Phycisphaeraceae bacterium]